MQRDDPTLNPYFRAQTDPVTGDKRGIVIPRSSLRRKVIALDNQLVEQQYRVEGDFIYFDQNTTGIATVKLNNTSEDPWPAAAQAGVADIPYMDIFVSAAAQAGKVLNMWYGYRARFSNPQQSIASIGSITNPVGVQGPRAYTGAPVLADLPVLAREVGYSYGVSFKSNTVLAANTPENILAAVSNVNGVIVWEAAMSGLTAGSPYQLALLAKATAPATVIDGDVLFINGSGQLANGSSNVGAGALRRPVFVASGKRLDSICAVLETQGHRFCNYTTL